MFPILEEAFEQAQVGDEYCVERFRRFAIGTTGWINCSLGSRFAKIIKRAGLTRWPRLFHALRASRETELAQEYPLHVVTAWLGNTPKIAMKHYLMVTENDFQKATQIPTQLAVQKATSYPMAGCRRESQETQKALGKRAFCEELLAVALRCNSPKW